ncbi:unnamed protein product, partial [Rotaria sp. Silwood1]
ATFFVVLNVKVKDSLEMEVFFSKSKLSLRQIFELMYCWAREIDSVSNLNHELRVLSSHTIVDWRNFCRDICAIYFCNNPQTIGDPDHTVEIDESAFGKRKYDKDRFIKTQWVFGGIDIDTRECFLVQVDKRGTATLLPIIEKYILPVTTIHLDEWRSNRALQNNPNYNHRTVNHFLNFVDPNTGVHTQNIQNTWMLVKKNHKKQGGFSRSLLTSYLEEFMWRQRFDGEPLKNLILQINSLYPVS